MTTNCVQAGKVALCQHAEMFTLHAKTFLEHQDELAANGLVLESARTSHMGGIPTSKIRVRFGSVGRLGGGVILLKLALQSIFGANEILGPKNLSGPFDGPRGYHYKLMETGYVGHGSHANGHRVDNIIIDIYV